MNPFDEEDENAPKSPKSTGLRGTNLPPKSLNPTITYEMQLEQANGMSAPSQEEADLLAQAGQQVPTEGDADAQFAAQATDIIGGTFGNYAKAKGVEGAGAPFQEAQKALKTRTDLRDQLHKNLMEKYTQKKAEREGKKAALYEGMSAGMKVKEFGNKEADRARLDNPIADNKKAMYMQLAKQRGVNIDLANATERDVADIEKAISMGVKPEAAKAGALDGPIPAAQLALMNVELKKQGRAELPLGSSYRDVDNLNKTIRGTSAQGTGVVIDKTLPFDRMGIPRTSVQGQVLTKLEAEATKVKESEAKVKGDIDQLGSLIGNARTGNPTAAAAAQRQIALMFNKGALSNEDVSAFAGDQTLLERFRRWADMNFQSGALVTGADGTPADPTKFKAIDPTDLDNFERILPSLRTGAASNKGARAGDIRRRADLIHPEAGNYIFGGEQQPSTSPQQSGTIPQQGVSKKRFIVDGQPRELSQEEFKAEKARGAKITR